MKYTIILFSVLLFNSFIHALEVEPPSKFKIGFELNTGVNGITFKPPYPGTISSQPQFGYSFSLGLGVGITKKITLLSGFGVAKRNVQYENTGLIFPSDIDPQQGFVSESRLDDEININELFVPLVFSFQPKKSNVFLIGGIQLNFQQEKNSTRIIYYGNGNVENLSNNFDLNTNVSSILGIGYSLSIANQLELNLSSVFQYYFKSYVAANSNIYNVGVNVGLYYKLK